MSPWGSELLRSGLSPALVLFSPSCSERGCLGLLPHQAALVNCFPGAGASVACDLSSDWPERAYALVDCLVHPKIWGRDGLSPLPSTPCLGIRKVGSDALVLELEEHRN